MVVASNDHLVHVLADHERVISVFRVEVVPPVAIWIHLRCSGLLGMRDRMLLNLSLWNARCNSRFLRQIRRRTTPLYDALRFFFVHGLDSLHEDTVRSDLV